jgi:hypothetical protein
MKRAVALLLSITMLFTGCIPVQTQPKAAVESETNTTSTASTEPTAEPVVLKDVQVQYDSLSDENLLTYVENSVYRDVINSLNSSDYFVDSVSAVYISKEYLEETAYNSQSNIYFGYTLAELNEMFQGTKYVFTLNDDGTTGVEALQEIEDVTVGAMLKDVAVGTGVILVCVSVSLVSAATAPAVSLIFATSAVTAATFAGSSAVLGGISAGIVRAIQTGDFKEALEAAGESAANGFKWGAISGAITGAAMETLTLKIATQNKLPWGDAAKIQTESDLPLEVISKFRSMDEYNVYKEAGLQNIMVNGKTALIPKFDLDFVSQLPDGTKVTNLERMLRGYAPLDPATGKPFQLHHIGQKNNAILAALTESQHQGNTALLHIFGKESEINRAEFATVRKEFWESLGAILSS